MELIDWYLEKTATNRKHQIETHSRATVKQLTSKTDEESIQKVRQLRRQIKSCYLIIIRRTYKRVM